MPDVNLFAIFLVAKVPPQRQQITHIAAPNTREVSVAATVSALQSLHRASPVTTVSSTGSAVTTSVTAQNPHSDVRPQDRYSM